MSEQCDGCHADALHFLCDECLGEDERDKLCAEVERLQDELGTQDAKIIVLNAALRSYGAHAPDCGDTHGCTCGFSAALAGTPSETRREQDRALAERVREACVKAISVPRRSIAWSPQIEGLVNDLRALDLDAMLEEP